MKTKSLSDLIYTDELRELLIKKYENEIVAVSLATMKTIQDRMKHGEISEWELQKCLVASMAGVFILGFKTGNDCFLKEAEEVKVHE
jgi:hypothetical protein